MIPHFLESVEMQKNLKVDKYFKIMRLLKKIFVIPKKHLDLINCLLFLQ